MEQYKKKKIRKRGNFNGVKEAVNAKNSYFRRRNFGRRKFRNFRKNQNATSEKCFKNVLNVFFRAKI
jgi:hypothetical protein